MYTSKAQVDGTNIVVAVFRDGKQIATWRVEINPDWNASAVLEAAERRIENFVNADADRIENQTREELAQTIVDTLNDRVW